MTDKTAVAAFDAAVKAAGSKCALAGALKITRQAIYQWRVVPVQHVLTVERLTGVPRTKLRPDIYPS